MALLLLAGVPPGALAQDTDDGRTFTWQAPASFEGPLAVDLTFTFPEATSCSYDLEMVWVEDEPAPFGHMYTLSEPDGGEAWSLTGGTSRDSYVHVDGHADTRDGSGDGRGEFFFGIESGFSTDGPGEVNLTLASPFYEAWEGNALSDVPLSVEVSCDSSFTVDRAAGHTVSLFDQHGFDGGSSASVQPSVPGAGFLRPAANVAHEERRTVDVDESETVLRLRGHQYTYVRGFTALFTGAAVGEFELDHPRGNASWLLTPTPVIDHASGSGTHEMALTRAAAATLDTLGGVLVGVDPVDDLDAATGGSGSG